MPLDADATLTPPVLPATPEAALRPPDTLVATVKRHSTALLQRAGIGGLVARSRWRQRRLLVLCYHGVSLGDEHLWNPRLFVSPQTLRRRFETLRRLGCTVLPLGEALDRLANGSLPRLAVVLTFDDGFHDFRARAWPLLREFGYPATVYLPTQRVEHNFPIVRLTLSYALWTRRDVVLDGRGLPGLDGSCGLAAEADRRRVVESLDRGMRDARLGVAAKDDIVREVMRRLGLDYEGLLASGQLRLLSPAEIAELAGPLVDFQLHTHRHQTPADAAAFVREIRDNRERVERMTGRPAVHFCYPSGIYRAAYPAILRREGIASATTCDPGLATARSNPLLLPRFVDTSAVGDPTFEAWLTGLGAWLPHRLAHAAVPD